MWFRKKQVTASQQGGEEVIDPTKFDTSGWYNADKCLKESTWEVENSEVTKLVLSYGSEHLHERLYYDLWKLAVRFPSAEEIVWLRYNPFNDPRTYIDTHYDKDSDEMDKVPCVQPKISHGSDGQIWKICKEPNFETYDFLREIFIDIVGWESIEYTFEKIDTKTNTSKTYKKLSLVMYMAKWFVNIETFGDKNSSEKNHYFLVVDEKADANIVVPNLIDSLLQFEEDKNEKKEDYEGMRNKIREGFIGKDLNEIMETTFNNVSIAPSETVKDLYDEEEPCDVARVVNAALKNLKHVTPEELRHIIINSQYLLSGESLILERLNSLLSPSNLTKLRNSFPKLRKITNYDNDFGRTYEMERLHNEQNVALWSCINYCLPRGQVHKYRVASKEMKFRGGEGKGILLGLMITGDKLPLSNATSLYVYSLEIIYDHEGKRLLCGDYTELTSAQFPENGEIIPIILEQARREAEKNKKWSGVTDEVWNENLSILIDKFEQDIALSFGLLGEPGISIESVVRESLTLELIPAHSPAVTYPIVETGERMILDVIVNGKIHPSVGFLRKIEGETITLEIGPSSRHYKFTEGTQVLLGPWLPNTVEDIRARYVVTKVI